MSDLLQSGHHPDPIHPDPRHPDPDQLSAFAEQALPPHEYQETLAHLAHCPDCRTIVALSLPVVEEAPALAPTPARKPRSSWFSGWNLAWPTAAALAGITFVVLYVQRAQLTSHHEAQQSQVAALREPAERPVSPSPQESLPAATSRPAAKSVKPPPPTPRPDNSQPLLNSQALTTLPITGRNTLELPEIAKPNHPTAVGGPASAPRPHADAAFRLPEGANIPTPSDAPAPPPKSSTPVAVEASNQSIESTNAVMSAPMLSTTSAQVTLPATPLPSGLPTLSMTSEEHRILAIDTHNALFLSQDDGQHWQPIPTPWPGHAVKVNLATRPTHGLMAAKASAGLMGSVAAPSTGAALALPTPAITGIVTDATGATIPGATVLVSNTQTQKAITLKTDTKGRYLATSLTPGTYQLEANCPGFQKRLLSGLSLAPNQTLQADLTLDIGTSTETVTVSADQIQVETAPPKKQSEAKTLRAMKAAPAMALPPIFEILTDTGARWISSDGQHWQPQPAQK